MEELVKKTKNVFDITIIVPNFNTDKKIPGTKTIFLDTSKILKLSTYNSIKFSFQNRRKIKQAVKDSDIVFVQDTALNGFLAIRYAKKYVKKVIFYVHQIMWEQFEKIAHVFFNKLFSKLIKYTTIKSLNRCDLVLLPYSDLRNKFRLAGVKKEMRVIRLGIDTNHFLPPKDKQESKKKIKLSKKTIIGYVGRVSKEKNTLVLLNAFRKLNQEKFSLLIVGDGQPEIVNMFKKNKNCKITGFVHNVKDYLQAMDIFVMPSLTETTSLATLEAMSCGLPVIVTKVGFMKDYVVKDHNGFFFPRNNPTLLALKIEKLVKDPEMMKKISHNARKTMTYSFSWERSINKIKRAILNLYYR